jgi:branched-chain amino acid aminotransferase
MKKEMIFIDGKFVLETDARVSLKTHALQYGTGCFEGIRAYYSEEDDVLYAFRIEDHFRRFLKSCHILFMKLPYSVEELTAFTIELLKKNYDKTDIYIRPFAFKSEPTVSSFNLQTLKTSVAIYTIAMGRYLDTKGLKANISTWKRVNDNAIPPRAKITGSYINTALAKTESQLNGYDEALFLDESGHVVEGSAENIFIIRGNTLITPSISEDILQGITRETIMMLARDHTNLTLVERSIGRTELYQADEVFLVGTGAEVAPVIEIDKREIGTGKTGPHTEKIKDLYFKLVHGQLPEYKQLFTKITSD